MRILALLALLQLGAAPRTAGKSHGVIHDTMMEGVTFHEYGRDGAEVPAPPGLLALEPPSLAFGARPLGAAHAERVTLFNRSNATLRLASVSGSTRSFHASFFDSKMVPPGGNATFSVVFLGRREGAADTNLYLHTSLGSHKYPVSGVAVMSEYRLSPLVGVKLPRNASFSPTVYMHNPHDYPIQISEVYSWGGGVSLELPAGGSEGPQSLWLIEPHSTRAVVRVHYAPPPRAPHHPDSPHTAYIRIKLNGTSEVLVVPVEVTAERAAGAYASPHALHAGLGGTRDPPKQMHVTVGNSGDTWLRLRRAAAGGACGGGAAPGADVAVVEHSLPPRSPPAHVATLTLYWDRIYEAGACYGEVHLTTADRCLTVPYHARALPGALVYNASTLSFVTSSPDVMMTREFTVRNEFEGPLHVTALEIAEDVRKHFAISGFTVRSIAPGATVTLFSLRPREFDSSLSLSSSVVIVTDVTDYRVPVHLYSGKLELDWQWPGWSGGALELGVVATSSTTTVRGTLANRNPAPVCVEACGADMEGASLQFLGCLRPHSGDKPAPCSCVEPGERGSLSLSAVAPAREATLRGRAWLRTAHTSLQIPVGLRAARGRLSAGPLHLNNCFPGTVCGERLRVDSSLSFRMSLAGVEPHPPDPRLYHRMPEGDAERMIGAHSSGAYGIVSFEPSLLCRPRCYSGVPFNSTQLEAWLVRPTADEDWLTTEFGLLGAHMQLYSELAARPAHNFTLRLHTTEIRNQLVSGSARWSWPRLWSAEGGASAGLVGVGGRGAFNVTLLNPSSSEPVYVHVALAAAASRVPAGLRAGECERPGCAWAPRSFRISATYLEDAALVRGGVSPALLLPPAGIARLQISFTPTRGAAPHTSLLYLRNNLTVLEVVRLTGQGAFPSFKFGNRKPGSGTPLLFELTEKHLKDCDRERSKLAAPPNLTVKRSFTARNTGDIPITISTFFINGFECEGYGFKVLNCAGFELQPNATHKVDIAFTPDFTLSKIRRTLILVSSLSTPVNYSLVTTVPAHLLAPCGASLSRPPWETYLRNATVSFMICVGLCVLAAGFLESDRILKTAMAAMARNSVVHPPLDLRSIGQCGKPWEWSDPPNRKEKGKMPVWSEERRMSDDGKLTKYEEVAPPKTKKKLSKKYSSEPASTEITPEKESPKNKKDEEWIDRETTNGEASENKSEEDNSTPPSETRDTVELLPPTEASPKILDLPTKILASLAASDTSKSKRHAKAERRAAPRCEEDASSTATESSNNDETEKEPEPPQRASVERTTSKKSSPSNTKKKCPSQYKDSYEGDGEDEEYDRPNKPTVTPAPYAGLSLKYQRNKDSNTPTPTKQNKQEAEKPKQSEPKTEPPQEPVHQIKLKTVSNKFTNNKKEKTAKKKSEKTYPYTTRNDIASTSSSNLSRNSPPAAAVISSCWGENRATFSDVVARSENTFSTVIAPKKIESKVEKPKENQGYSYERKKEKAPLGPIGSSVFQKNSPPGRPEENHASLYSHPVRQITEPTIPKALEDLVPADNNNSFFYFGNDNVRSPEVIQPREVGVIGKPTTPVFPTPIGQTFGQISYSPSILEDYGGLENGRGLDAGRMEFEGAWEPRRDSPGLISAPNTTTSFPQSQNAFPRSVYSGDIGPSYPGLWDMPTTTASSPIGAVGQTVGSIGQSVGSIGQSVGSVGQTVGSMGPSMVSVGMGSVGSIGQSMGSVGQAIGSIGQSVGAVGQPVGAVGQAISMEDKSAHAQWLWGYNGVRPPPGFPPTQQPVARPFDPFQSMSSIWSPGTLDHWSSRPDENQPQ